VFDLAQLGLDGGGDAQGEFVLELEDILKIAI
jgi:hypothetical protein